MNWTRYTCWAVSLAAYYGRLPAGGSLSGSFDGCEKKAKLDRTAYLYRAGTFSLELHRPVKGTGPHERQDDTHHRLAAGRMGELEELHDGNGGSIADP